MPESILYRGGKEFRREPYRGDIYILVPHMKLMKPSDEIIGDISSIIESFVEIFMRDFNCPSCHCAIYNSQNYQNGPRWFYQQERGEEI